MKMLTGLCRFSLLFGLFIIGYKTPISQAALVYQPIKTELCFSRSANPSGPQACYQTPGASVTMIRGDAEAWCDQWTASLISIDSDDVRKEVENFLTQAQFSSERTVITSANRVQRQWTWVNGQNVNGYANGTQRVSFYDTVSGEWQANDSVVADVQVKNLNNATFAFLTARCNQQLSYFICNYPDINECANRNPPAMLYFETTCYSIHTTQKVTWWQARNLCLSYGGDLSVVFNKDFNYLIDQHQLTPNTTYWIGLYRELWEWRPNYGTAFEMKFSNWAHLSPQDGSNKSCMCLWGGYGDRQYDVTTVGTTAAPAPPWQWIDCDCNKQYQVVCQRMGLHNTTPPADPSSGGTTLTPPPGSNGNGTQGGQQSNNSTAVGLGVGLGLGLFILLVLILLGLYFFIYKRNQAEKSAAITESTRHFSGLESSANGFSKFNENSGNYENPDLPTLVHPRRLAGSLPSLPGTNSEDLRRVPLERYQDLTSSWRGIRPDPPHGYERLQGGRPPTPPPFVSEDDSKSGYYEKITDSPRISVVIENPRDSGNSTADAKGNSTETSNRNSSDGGYSSNETSGDSAGWRNVANTKAVDTIAEYLDTNTVSTEQLPSTGNTPVTKNPSDVEKPDSLENPDAMGKPDAVENPFYHKYYNRDAMLARDSSLGPSEMPENLKTGDYLHPVRSEEESKRVSLDDDGSYSGSVYKSPSEDYKKYLMVLPDISYEEI